jgi:hypothetical protein
MKFVKGFGQFWYDFIIGDDWKIAFAIGLVIVIGAVIASVSATDAGWIAPTMGVALALAFVIGLVIDVRRA